MPIYVNGKKIKDLHYAGKKIKEAWYEGKKVYSSGPPAWTEGAVYSPGDTVYTGVNSKRYFRCIYDHTAVMDENRPGQGSFWGVYWEEIT